MKPVRLVAFYLPQFHPIPENDAWWGRGFTEWTNVTRATPLFPGHPQPRRPADLGYYDLRVPEVREQQAALAKSYGIYGFCHYFYWFGGRRLLERPLDEMLTSGRPDFPFCLCWANENWTRRWDGLDHEVLIRQEHSAESDARLILDVAPILRDPRYIHWDGKPVLLVYRADILPEPQRTAEIWRETARGQGIPDLHLVACQTFGLGDPRPLGFDAAAEFPPHNSWGHRLEAQIPGLHPEFRGKIHDYRDAVKWFGRRGPEPYRLHRTVMVAWDNTPRRGLNAHMWHQATPDAYGRWLRGAIEASARDVSDPQPLVFINAWNEWAEGAYLEPDETWGHAWLQATRLAVLAASAGDAESALVDTADESSLEALRERVRCLDEELAHHRRTNAWLRAELEARDALERARATAFSPEPPPWLPPGELTLGGRMRIEEIGPLEAGGRLVAAGGRRVRIAGWAFAEGIDPEGEKAAASLVLLAPEGDRVYFAGLPARVPRPDVSHEVGGGEAPLQIGFDVTASYEGVEPRAYDLGIAQRSGELVLVTLSGQRVVVPSEGG